MGGGSYWRLLSWLWPHAAAGTHSPSSFPQSSCSVWSLTRGKFTLSNRPKSSQTPCYSLVQERAGDWIHNKEVKEKIYLLCFLRISGSHCVSGGPWGPELDSPENLPEAEQEPRVAPKVLWPPLLWARGSGVSVTSHPGFLPCPRGTFLTCFSG